MKKIIIANHIDHIKRYSEIENNFSLNPSLKIFAFTIDVRLYLKSMNIQYDIPEKFISEDLAREMDNYAYYLVLNWHDNLFEFKGISLGLLFEKVFFFYLCKIIRYIQVFSLLIESEKPNEIIEFRDNDCNIEEFNDYIE